MRLLTALHIFTVLIIQSTAWSQNSAVDQLLNMKKEAARQSESSSEDVQRLQGELARLGQRLVETNQRLTTLQQTLPVQFISPIGLDEIVHHLENKNFGSCIVEKGEHLGEYFIKRGDVKIRFVFLAKDDVLGPKSSLIKGEQGEDVLQIFQPGYDSESINKEGLITATLRFKMSAEGVVGPVIHAIFIGQRVEDKWFGHKSSFTIKDVACVL